MSASRDGARSGSGFSTMPERVAGAPLLGCNLDDPVSAGLGLRHLGKRHHAPPCPAVDFDELRETGRVRQEQLVRKQHRKWFVANEMPRTKDGMAQAQRPLLTRELGGAGREDRARCERQGRVVIACRKMRVELLVAIEMIPDRRLSRPVTKMISSIPAARASSTAYWMSGLSTTGSITFGTALLAGRNRVAMPATGSTAFLTDVAIPRASPC